MSADTDPRMISVLALQSLALIEVLCGLIKKRGKDSVFARQLAEVIDEVRRDGRNTDPDPEIEPE